MKHVETNNKNKGQNVGTDRTVFNDFPVSLKVHSVRNSHQFIPSSSDEDDPFNMLRGKPYPCDEQNTLHEQEKFTMPNIMVTLDEDILNKSRKKIEIKNRTEEILNTTDQKYDYKYDKKTGNKFSTDVKSINKTFKEKCEVNRKDGEIKERKYEKSSLKVEDTNDTKALISKLVTKCRTLALDHIKKDNTNNCSQKDIENKERTIWEWKPKKEVLKNGYKLDTSSLNIQPKSSNFIGLFKQFCMANCADVRIVIEDIVFHCHKIVLQCYSKFFQTHIRSKGFKKELMIEIPHDKVNKNVFMDIYIWMLNSPKNCKNSCSNYNVLNMLIASAFLKIDELEKHCWHFINDEQNFDEASAFDLYCEARHANYWSVMELMIKRVKTFFLTLIQTDKFLKLSENELHLLLDSNNIAVHSEIEVFFALVLWLRKRNQSKPWECSLFRLIRFSHISPIQLVELQAMPELHFITKHHPVNEMIESGIRVSIRREYSRANHLSFNDPEPYSRNWLQGLIIYKSFNEFIESLLVKRNEIKKFKCNLIRKEIMETLKMNAQEIWTSIKNDKK